MTCYPTSLRKRCFDLLFSLFLLPVLFPLILILVLLATVDTGKIGLFIQYRVGSHKQMFPLFKVRTISSGSSDIQTTQSKVHVISPYSSVIRRYKLDELPQLINIILGHMSFVGPRADVPGFADQVENSYFSSLKPGVTSVASIVFKDEYKVFDSVENPEIFNSTYVWPLKVRLNVNYAVSSSFSSDLIIIFATILSIFSHTNISLINNYISHEDCIDLRSIFDDV